MRSRTRVEAVTGKMPTTGYIVLVGLIVLVLSSFATSNTFTSEQENTEIDTLYINVASGEVEAPMIVLEDDYALGGQFVQVEGDNKSSSEPPNRGKVTLEVELAGGDYTIWGRTIAQDEGSDSFWFQVNDGQIYNWNGIPITPYWGWSQVQDFQNREVVTWSLPAGTHTITIYYREPKTKIDALFVTNTDSIPTKGNDNFPPNLVNLVSPPTPWQNAYNLTLSDFEFEHPMTVITSDELEMIKYYVDQQIEPQYTAYLELINDAEEAQSFVPDAPPTMDIMGGYEPNSNLNEVREQLWRNCHAAYSSALAYQFTGETKYADKAVEVMMDWANANTTFTGGDRGLQLGSWFSQVLYAADLIYDYTGWTSEQRSVFKSWWRNNVLIHTTDVLRGKDNNWKDAGLLGVLTAGIVLEDTTVLKEGLIQLKSYFFERTDESVRNPGVDWKIRKDDNGVYLPREVVRNNGSSGLTYTAYAMTTMVQCLDIAKYIGFDMWHDTTAQGAGIKDVVETYYQWDIRDKSFPWHPNPNKSDKRRNLYELANTNLNLSDNLVNWTESNRPQNAREGDEYATLTKGDIHISKLESTIGLEDNQVYEPGDTIHISINVDDPFGVGLDNIKIKLDGEIKSTIQELNSETFLIMPDTDFPEHIIDIIVTDDFGVQNEKKFTALDSRKAKILELEYDSNAGAIVLSPDQPFYSPGQEVTINAIAKFPYFFAGWSGDNTSSNSELTLVLDRDYELNAVFEQVDNPRLNFNFQPENSDKVDEYVVETGKIFDLVDTIRYGWITDFPINGIKRSSNEIWDERKLSYIQMQQGIAEGITWEFELTNGTYNIEIGLGDPGNLNHVNTIKVEDSILIDEDGKDAFDSYILKDFKISDETLSITPVGENVKINYVKIAATGTDLKRHLAISGGTGTGEYAESTEVTIEADAPTGTDAFEWVGDTTAVTDFENNITTVIIPSADVSLKAAYFPTYELLVQGGEGSGNYKEGKFISVIADNDGNNEFIQWLGDTQYLEDPLSATTRLEMPDKAVEIIAEFESILALDIAAKSIRLYPNPTNSTANLEFELSRRSTLTIEIIDLSGKTLDQFSKDYSPGIHIVKLNENLAAGVNIIRVSSGNNFFTQLLIVNK